MQTINEKYPSPQVQVGDRIRVLLFTKWTHEYTDWATVIEEHGELFAEFDDAEVHNDTTQQSYVMKQPIKNLRYRLFLEGEAKDQ